MQQGRLHCIGLGITLGSQLTLLNAELLRSADLVFSTLIHNIWPTGWRSLILRWSIYSRFTGRVSPELSVIRRWSMRCWTQFGPAKKWFGPVMVTPGRQLAAA